MGVPAHFSILWPCWPSRMHIYGSVGPLECIFMALLALSNAGVPAQFYTLIDLSGCVLIGGYNCMV